ncbi:unnamed protein product, partial [Meganyctiphanes norvegica]
AVVQVRRLLSHPHCWAELDRLSGAAPAASCSDLLSLSLGLGHQQWWKYDVYFHTLPGGTESSASCILISFFTSAGTCSRIMFEVYLLLLGALMVSNNAQIPKQQLPLTKYVSSRVSKPQQSRIDVEFLESTLRALGVEHVVLVAPRTYDMQMSHILTHLLNKSISFELLLENNINMKEYWNTGESVNRTGGNISITNNTSNTTMSTEEINVCYTYTGSEMVDKKLNITCNSFFDSLTFRYLYSPRYRLTRREMVVLVYGPVTWVAQAAAKLLSFKIFGA